MKDTKETPHLKFFDELHRQVNHESSSDDSAEDPYEIAKTLEAKFEALFGDVDEE